jgi:ABC-type multidrug transport system fused ATPase/permease subunit
MQREIDAAPRPPEARALPPLFEPPRRRLLLALIGVGALQAAIAAAAALGMRAVFDALSGRAWTVFPAIEHLAWPAAAPGGTAAVVAMVGVALFAALATLMLRVQGARLGESLGQQYVAAVRVVLLRHLFSMAPRRHQRMRHGHLMARLTGDLGALRRWAGRTVAPLVVGAATLVVAALALAWTMPGLALGLAAVGVPLAVWAWHVSARLERALRAERAQHWALAGQVGERLAEAAVVQAHAQAERELKRLRRRQRRLHDTAVARAREVAVLKALPPALGMAVMGVVAAYGSSQVVAGQWSSGTLAGLLTLLALTLAPLRDLALGLVNWRSWRVSREKLAGFLAQEPLPAAATPARLPAGTGALRLDGLVAGAAMRPLTLALEARSTLALEGASGSGRSAVLEAICGLLTPAAGRVLLDSQDLSGCDAKTRAQHVVLVSADLPLLRGSVAGNLRYRDKAASRDAMLDALRQAGVDALAACPVVLTTVVSEGGRNLPRGVRARLALARALIGAPRLLLIDDFDDLVQGEPAADEPLEALLERPPCTIVIATRRAEWAARCHRRHTLVAAAAAPAEPALALVHVA